MFEYYFTCNELDYPTLVKILSKLGVVQDVQDDKGDSSIVATDKGSYLLFSKDKDGMFVSILRTPKDLFTLADDKGKEDQEIDKFTKELSKYFVLDKDGKAMIPDNPIVVFL